MLFLFCLVCFWVRVLNNPMCVCHEHVYKDQILHAWGFVYVRKPLSTYAGRCIKTLILLFHALLHIICFYFGFLFICFILHKFLFALFTCLFVFNIFRLGFIFLFLSFNAMPFIHMSMH